MAIGEHGGTADTAVVTPPPTRSVTRAAARGEGLLIVAMLREDEKVPARRPPTTPLHPRHNTMPSSPA